MTDEQIETLMQCFRAQGAPTRARDMAAAARAANLDPRTVRRMWEASPRVGQKPLRDRLAEEQMLARAKLTTETLKTEAAAAPMLARDDAASQMAREALLSRASREAVLGALGSVAPLIRQVNKLAVDVAEASGGMPPIEQLRVIRGVASIVRDLVGAANNCIELERRRTGEPTETIRLEIETTPASVEEIAATIEAARRALARVTEVQDAASPDA